MNFVSELILQFLFCVKPAKRLTARLFEVSRPSVWAINVSKFVLQACCFSMTKDQLGVGRHLTK